MPKVLRVAGSNVENLFGRAKVLNKDKMQEGNDLLAKIDELALILLKDQYSASDKQKIVKLYTEDLKSYIEIREDRGKLFSYKGRKITGVKAGGASGWEGSIEFLPEKFSEVSRENTARMLKDLKADLICMVEVESRFVLKSFDTHLLKNRYPYEMLIDANDPRGIDVGLYSKYPIGRMWTHMFDKKGKKTIFSRDCLEIEVLLSDKRSLYFLCNHFKSRGYDYSGTAAEKRKMQAQRVVEILKKYDLKNDWVIVAGDFNDNPQSAPLQPLMKVKDLYDVLALQFPNDPNKRWTYHYDNFEQIDFLMVSTPLKDRFKAAGVERRGMYELKKLTTSSNGLVEVEEEYSTVTRPSNAASDHGAVWAEFKL